MRFLTFKENMMEPIGTCNMPMADKGLVSYRYKGRYGWIMIGAKDIDGALREAARSTSDPITVEKLQVLSGAEYIDAQTNAIPAGLTQWVIDLQTARSWGHATLAKAIKKNIDKAIKAGNFDRDTVYQMAQVQLTADHAARR